jgi:predicted XRE-type DNA-binding protein
MSRNPFLDLGFSPEEAAALHIRSQLAATLEYHIERKGWSQTEAARALRVPPPTVSKIVNGNIAKLSIEFLIKLIVRADLPASGMAGTMRPGTQKGAQKDRSAARQSGSQARKKTVSCAGVRLTDSTIPPYKGLDRD